MIPEYVQTAFDDDDRYFQNPLQKFQFYDKYSRFSYEKNRRETWEEAVQRAVNYLRELSKNKLPEQDYLRIQTAMLNMDAFCSMRLFAMGGEAARRNGASIYNCAYLAIDSIDAMCEVLILSMAGCGVGYSVEHQYVRKLHIVQPQVNAEPYEWTIGDSTEGWVESFRYGLQKWYQGEDVVFDLSLIRPAGTPLKTKGGRASGPQPLRELLDFARKTILNAQGRKLTPLEVHDIITKIGDCAVSGGTRRAAQISLFDFDDSEMLNCKTDGFWAYAPQRANANNSAVWPDENLTLEQVDAIMRPMLESGSGEPGIFRRANANKHIPDRRKPDPHFGGNPCMEIFLRDQECCNLTQAILRPNDTYETLQEKVEIATIIGTIQSMETNFPGLRPQWEQNSIEERLLGVDITGQMDNPGVLTETNFQKLKKFSVNVNDYYAKLLGINPSAAITCVKPSGNSSILFDCSAGLHGRYAPYYIRRVRINAHSPVRHVLEDSGIPLFPEIGQEYTTATTLVAEFPVQAPEGAITIDQLSALEQMEHWLKNKIYWTEHNPSVTITYRPEEIDTIIQWVFEHQGLIGGMAFLPYSNKFYDLAPYEAITEDEYYNMRDRLPDIDWSLLWKYEQTDMTTSAQELACMSGLCEI